VRTADFLDVRRFLSEGGQKGPQRTILREGTYAINLAQFVIITREHIYGLMLETNDGPPVRRDAECDRPARRLRCGRHQGCD